MEAAIAVLSALVAVRSYYINTIVPEPYLDEVFHIPQALSYCANNFTTWDPKLTTPAGLYLLSYPLSYLHLCTPSALRALNGLGLSLLLPLIVYRIRQTSDPAAAHTAFNTALFPLLSFFSSLYYTDIWSTIWILCAVLAVQRNRPWAAGVFCWTALWFRQTNIVWTAMLAGTHLVTRLHAANRAKDEDDMVTLRDPVWSRSTLSNFLTTPQSLAAVALANPFTTAAAALPFMLPLGSFAYFLHWNAGTIVLGDATAHVAGVHLPQLFYFTLFAAFFSWPLYLRHLLPTARALLTPVTAVGTLLVAAAIWGNTVLHPYLMADNRHYTFYLFRRVLLPLGVFMAPVYYGAAAVQSAVLAAAGGKKDAVKTSWVLLYLAATAATLCSAPLVEPRYFILPWVLWRLQTKPAAAERWAETVWFLVVGVGTTWVFLNWDFTAGWEAEEGMGRVQRFMW
ncbi:alpha-2-glucosyltransferase Alg10 [Geopyxis carbonaria]|nr:alpha-2-glucosyltransferase Alg10 [Geopyxis carbonaria]